MQVTLLVVGLIVGFGLGLGVGWYLWHGLTETEERSERPERRQARQPRSYEPSTPPQHRPTPRPRPVTALRYATSALSGVDDDGWRAPAPARPAQPTSIEAVAVAAAPARVAAPASEPEPFEKYEYRPAPRRERPVSLDAAQPSDRRVLQELLDANRRLTADAELRLRRDGGPAAQQLHLDERGPARPAASAPAPDDLIARHRKLDEDSRRMGRRVDEAR